MPEITPMFPSARLQIGMALANVERNIKRGVDCPVSRKALSCSCQVERCM